MAFVTADFARPAAWQNTAPTESVKAIPGHNIPMALVGTFISNSGGSVSTPDRHWAF